VKQSFQFSHILFDAIIYLYIVCVFVTYGDVFGGEFLEYDSKTSNFGLIFARLPIYKNKHFWEQLF